MNATTPQYPDTLLCNRAIDIAIREFEGVTRSDGKAYVSHCIQAGLRAVAFYMAHPAYYKQYGERGKELVFVIGVLHDVPADKKKTGAMVMAEIESAHTAGALVTEDEAELLIDALDRLNKHNYPSYLEYTLATMGNWISWFAKQGDLDHNLSDKPSKHNREKYLLAQYILKLP